MEPVTPVLLQYGALGVMVLLMGLTVKVLFDQVKADKDRETARADRLEAALQESNKTVQEMIIPAALDMVNTTKALIDLIANERARRSP
jgi:hypothetical protein